ITFSALSPLGPCLHSNSTASPSLRVLYPFSWIAEKCTKTSSPVDRWMNPYPLAPLNHFTTPFSFKRNPFPTFIYSARPEESASHGKYPLASPESGNALRPVKQLHHGAFRAARTRNFCSSLMML